ncbi:hypothetical protein [uncultured Neptuniibacter sp.]|uniref:hypothetical protein n=1 Tax=uncultured Neptuniibacter sp. TaxID=502143 RepID=UPI00263142D7|nr:hypothetical protein [uncultured Neptuniibacter sp.]
MNYLYLMILTLLPACTLAADLSCQEKYDLYAMAQTKWQQGSTELIIQKMPDYKQLAEHYRDQQLLRVKRRAVAVQWLLQYSPGQVKTDRKLNRWLDFSPELEARISTHSDAFKRLSEEIELPAPSGLKMDGDLFRLKLRESVMTEATFKEKMTDFFSEVSALDKRTCHN